MRNSFRFFILAIALVSAIACGGGGGGSPATHTYYLDADLDGYGDAANSTVAASAPSGYVANDDDCGDANAAINPSATEIYDSIDNDCDGSTDEGFFTFYKDGDLDGYGDAANTTVAASAPSGYVADNTDCYDYDSEVNPGMPEIPSDYIDNNCNGVTDESLATFYRDQDGDGYGVAANTTTAYIKPAGYSYFSTDCDDTNAAVYPGATEILDTLDNDCDGTADEGLSASFLGLADDGAATAPITITEAGSYTLALDAGARVELDNGDGTFTPPAPGDEVILSIVNSTASVPMPEGFTAVSQFDVVVTVNGTPREASFWNATSGTGDEGLNITITVPSGALPDGATGILYDISSGTPKKVGTSAITTGGTSLPRRSTIGRLEPRQLYETSADGGMNFNLPNSGSYAGGGSGGGSGAAPSGSFWSEVTIADQGCITVDTVEVCGPCYVDRLEIVEESTAEVLGSCNFSGGDLATTGVLPPGYQFWCERGALGADGSTKIKISSKQANLPLVHAYLKQVAENIPMWEVYAKATVLTGGDGATYTDPYQQRDFEFAGTKEFYFKSKEGTYSDMRTDAYQPIVDAGYETQQRNFQSKNPGYEVEIDAHDTLDARKKIEEDVIKTKRWKTGSQGETKGNRGYYEKSDGFKGTTKATMTLPMIGTKVWEITGENITFTKDSASSSAGQDCYKITGGTITQTFYTSTNPACTADPASFTDSYPADTSDGLLCVNSGVDPATYLASASISARTPLLEHQYQLCCYGMPCESYTLTKGEQEHEWLWTGEEKQADAGGNMTGSAVSPNGSPTFEWDIRPDTGSAAP